jgi:hypothetical protein
MISTILLVFAFVLFILATFEVGSPRFKLGWAACACFVARMLFFGLK